MKRVNTGFLFVAFPSNLILFVIKLKEKVVQILVKDSTRQLIDPLYLLLDSGSPETKRIATYKLSTELLMMELKRKGRGGSSRLAAESRSASWRTEVATVKET